MTKRKLGFSVCGSFCTFAQTFTLMETLSQTYDILPIFSYNAAQLDTRFGSAADHIARAEQICGKKAILTIPDAEPIGPHHLIDLMLVAPCTGNTLAKLAHSIVDTPVLMAVKSHLRNSLPVILTVSTNDALSGCAKNIGILQNLKNYYFVPMRQDNCQAKPFSVVSDFALVPAAVESARQGVQLQPILL